MVEFECNNCYFEFEINDIVSKLIKGEDKYIRCKNCKKLYKIIVEEV